MLMPAWLDETFTFPDTALALDDPEGLLAVGGDLQPERLVAAYKLGIFPWYSDGQPILWWSPSPRTILVPQELHIGRSNKKLLKRQPFKITVDQAFEDVVRACSEVPRKEQDGTWITEEMIDAYVQMHDLGHTHSVEAWQGGSLVGGLYGVAIGKAFFGESMFSHESGASKLAFMTLVAHLKSWGYSIVDCQIYTEYLASFGATQVDRATFEQALASSVSQKGQTDWVQHWQRNIDGLI